MSISPYAGKPATAGLPIDPDRLRRESHDRRPGADGTDRLVTSGPLALTLRPRSHAMNPNHPTDPPAEHAAPPADAPPSEEEILRRMAGEVEQVESEVRKLDQVEEDMRRNSMM
jgi:hypothetical protein